MIVLYQFPGGDGLNSISPPCLKVEMALRRLGLEYRLVNCRSRAEARRVSRTGRLPVLEFDGRRIPDSINILDALEQRLPEADLWPAAPEQRLQDRLWEHFANDHLYFIGYYLRWCVPAHRERMATAIVGRAPFYVRGVFRTFFLPTFVKRAHWVGIGGKPIARVFEDYERGLEMTEAGLAGGPFLQGRDRPGRGDLACASLLAQAGFRDTMPDVVSRMRRRPRLLEYGRRVFEACAMEAPPSLVA